MDVVTLYAIVTLAGAPATVHYPVRADACQTSAEELRARHPQAVIWCGEAKRNGQPERVPDAMDMLGTVVSR